MGIGKIARELMPIAKSWFKKTRTVENLAELTERGIRFPLSTVRAEIINAANKNNPKETMEVIRFFDRHNSIGSITHKSNGERIIINNNRYFNGNRAISIDTPEFHKLGEDWYSFSKRMITKEKYRRNELRESSRNFVFNGYNELDSKKPKIISKIREFRRHTSDGQKLETELAEYNSQSRKAVKQLKYKTEINRDNEISLTSVSHSDNVVIDKTNPYFYKISLPAEDLAKVEYAGIVKRENMKGLAPELNLNCFKWYNETFPNSNYNLSSTAAFICPSKGFIGIALNQQCANNSTIINHVNHEAEHLLRQHRDLYRLIGDNARDKIDFKNPVARNFYEGSVKRFGEITKGSKEYDEALKYQKADNIYDSTVVPNTKSHNANTEARQKYWENYLELKAFQAGDNATNNYNQALTNIQSNFPTLKLPTENLKHYNYQKFNEIIELT